MIITVAIDTLLSKLVYLEKSVIPARFALLLFFNECLIVNSLTQLLLVLEMSILANHCPDVPNLLKLVAVVKSDLHASIYLI